MAVKEGTAVQDKEVDSDGTKNEDSAENNEDGLEQGGEQDIDAGGEGGEVGKSGESDQGKSDEGEGVEPALDSKDIEIAKLQERISGLEKPQPREEVKPWTDEQWLKHEEETGLTKSQTSFMVKLVQSVIGSTKKDSQEITERLARFEKNDAINELGKEKEFNDISKYKNGIEEFLGKFPTNQHNNKELLGMAYYHAKGKGASGAVKKAVSSTEINRKIISKSSLNQGGKAKDQGRSVAGFKLTPAEESAFETYGDKFKSKEEYIKYLPRFRNVQK